MMSYALRREIEKILARKFAQDATFAKNLTVSGGLNVGTATGATEGDILASSGGAASKAIRLTQTANQQIGFNLVRNQGGGSYNVDSWWYVPASSVEFRCYVAGADRIKVAGAEVTVPGGLNVGTATGAGTGQGRFEGSTTDGVFTALYLSNSYYPTASNWNSGQAIYFGYDASVQGAARIIAYHNPYNAWDGRLVIQTHGTSDGVWNGLEIDGSGNATFAGSINVGSGPYITLSGTGTFNWSLNTYGDANWGISVYNSGSAYHTRLNYYADASTERNCGFYDENNNRFNLYTNTNGYAIAAVRLGVNCTPGYRLEVAENAAAWMTVMGNASSTGHGLWVAAGSSSSQYIQSWNDKDGNNKGWMDSTGCFWVSGWVDADDYTTHTAWFEGDALSLVKEMRGKNNKPDMATFPDYLKIKTSRPVGRAADGMTILTEQQDAQSLGKTVAMLTVAVQQLTARLETLEGKV